MSNLREGPLVPVFLAHGDKCNRCTASIIWTVTTANNARLPVDALPHVDGTIDVVFHDDGREPSSTVLTGMLRDQAERGSLYVAHFATCPKAPRRNTRPRR